MGTVASAMRAIPDAIAKGVVARLAEGDADVLGRVVPVDVEVTRGVDVEVEHAVLGNLGQHVIQESDARGSLEVAGAVDVHGDRDVGLVRCSLDGGGAVSQCGRPPGARVAGPL